MNLMAYDSFKDMADSMAQKSNSPVLTTQQLQQDLNSNKGMILLDARDEVECEVSHLKNAYHIGYDDFDLEKTLKKIDKSKKVVVYCSVGYRSGDITKKLRNNGVDAYNLYGGIFQWINLGNKVYTRDLKTKEDFSTQKIHGFNRKWGKWLSKGHVVY